MLVQARALATLWWFLIWTWSSFPLIRKTDFHIAFRIVTPLQIRRVVRISRHVSCYASTFTRGHAKGETD